MLRSTFWGVLAAMLVQAAPPVVYQDAAGRFTFMYSSAFGAPSRGTNDGFADRVAAIRFSRFPARFGGEAVLTRGFPLIDLQAIGGLYDGLALEIFPEPIRAAVVAQLPRLTLNSFCAALAQPRHVDANLPAFAALTQMQRQTIASVDQMRNANPHVVECRTAGDVAVFDKERAFQPGSPVQHVYGAVRFLGGAYSTFQFIAGGDTPDPATMSAMEELVASFRATSYSARSAGTAPPARRYSTTRAARRVLRNAAGTPRTSPTHTNRPRPSSESDLWTSCIRCNTEHR